MNCFFFPLTLTIQDSIVLITLHFITVTRSNRLDVEMCVYVCLCVHWATGARLYTYRTFEANKRKI